MGEDPHVWEKLYLTPRLGEVEKEPTITAGRTYSLTPRREPTV